MKPTLRKNNRHMVSIRPPAVHLDASDVARILADHDDPDELGSLSKQALGNLVRTGLANRGSEHFHYAHERWGDEWPERVAAATAAIRRHWPEWADEISYQG